MPRRLGDLKMAAHRVELGAAGQQLVTLGELADDLVGRMPTSAHDAALLAPILEQRTRTTPGPLRGGHLTLAISRQRAICARRGSSERAITRVLVKVSESARWRRATGTRIVTALR